MHLLKRSQSNWPKHVAGWNKSEHVKVRVLCFVWSELLLTDNIVLKFSLFHISKLQFQLWGLVYPGSLPSAVYTSGLIFPVTDVSTQCQYFVFLLCVFCKVFRIHGIKNGYVGCYVIHGCKHECFTNFFVTCSLNSTPKIHGAHHT